MKTFIYVYKNPASKLITKKLKANTEKEAKQFLKQKSIIPLSLHQEGSDFFSKLNTPQHIPQDDLVAFFQLFSGCIETGLTIKESLFLLSKQLENQQLITIISNIIIHIEGGDTLSESFNRYPTVFPNFIPMVLKAGEASGNLAEVLTYISNYMDKMNDIKKQLQSVLTYPIIVSSIGILLLLLILLFVAPSFKTVFQESQKTLPLATLSLFAISDFIRAYLIPIMGITFLIILSIAGILKTQKGKHVFDTLILQVPLAGPLITQAIMLRFLGCFSILINHNVPIVDSLNVLENISTNTLLKQTIVTMRKDVTKGLPLSRALLKNKTYISPMISYTISMGEKAGNLGKSLMRITNFMDKELTFNMKKLSSRLNPIITFALGILVLFVALAIYLPIFDLMLP